MSVDLSNAELRTLIYLATSEETQMLDEPTINQIIDKMLTERDNEGQPDPKDPGLFPSLGFENEVAGSYYIQVKQGSTMVSVWRVLGEYGVPESYHIHVYHLREFGGVYSWGGDSTKKIVADDLVQVQAIIHNIFTSEGNYDDQETE